ncbi:MAG: DinB family protein [Gemmatimonadetes bacterium]|uniref:DinB family protein n=1 Tax=Candidatus Kutchimonas denitrificans TaxID=3056748 RepID=A0AAE4ZB26_9BACT|nr:DinB family protein [Gemmatimonadota bacterium]NIR74846.1 DinB family protein [Candidatus Kutchimonas denitrificans]NIR99957.1 DinB family protein [Gemmatimonadota bacterium]NIT65541.1 DinB family protein [Gemmatimonadota bacterium]NIU52511.1 DinB family protein [Gemmatimonadota bacterium]
MWQQIPWIERKFSFDFPTGLYPEIIVRLAGTPARLREFTAELPSRTLVKRQDDSWSIQENVGHLLDLEDLFDGRLDDYQSGSDELRPADMSNRATEAAGHNDRPIEELLREFRRRREAIVERLEGLPPEAFGRSAFHARLSLQKRLVDTCYFFAEHDDHHIARIVDLIHEHA